MSNEQEHKQTEPERRERNQKGRAVDSIQGQVQRIARVALGEDYEVGPLLGQGGNSTCYAVKNDPNLVLIAVDSTGFRSNDGGLETHNHIMELERTIPDEVQIARTLSIAEEDGRVVLLQERAQGEVLHDRHNTDYAIWSDKLQSIADIPQEHYTKLVEDLIALQKAKLSIDPSKPDNAFYDKDAGFTLIDLLHTDESINLGVLCAMLINTSHLFGRFRDQVHENDLRNIHTILTKLDQAGAPADAARIREMETIFSKTTPDAPAVSNEAEDGVW